MIRAAIESVCNVEYGTRVVRKRDGGTIYPVYGGGGATFRMDAFNREDRLVIARFAISEQCTRFVEGKFFLNDSGLTVSPRDPQAIDPRYLDYHMLALNDRIYSLSRGSAQRNLSTKAFRLVEIRYPQELADQKRIVAILDAAFAAIDTVTANAEKNLANARELFESQLNAIDAEPALLGDLVEIRTGKLDANAAVEGGKYAFFTCAREVYAINNHAFDCEAILLAGNNAVGDFNVKHYRGKFNAYQRTYVITVNEKNRVLYRFLYFQILKSLAKFKSQSVGAGTKFLKLGMIKNMTIGIPTIAEQRTIVTKVDSILQETENLEIIYHRRLSLLAVLKRSILRKAFAGELTTSSKRIMDRTLSAAEV